MNLQSLVVVVLRLMALDFLLRVAVQLSPSLLSFVRLRDNTTADAALPWLILVCLFIAAVLLWVFALPIARLVTRRVPREISLGALTLADCYSVAFIGVGLFYISSGLPQALNWFHYLFKTAATTSGNSWKEQVNWYQVCEAFVPFLVGVVLLVKGRAWAVALALRHARAESPNPSLEPTAAAGGPQDKPRAADGGSRGSA